MIKITSYRTIFILLSSLKYLSKTISIKETKTISINVSLTVISFTNPFDFYLCYGIYWHTFLKNLSFLILIRSSYLTSYDFLIDSWKQFIFSRWSLFSEKQILCLRKGSRIYADQRLYLLNVTSGLVHILAYFFGFLPFWSKKGRYVGERWLTSSTSISNTEMYLRGYLT